jgi:hypothetical protein
MLRLPALQAIAVVRHHDSDAHFIVDCRQRRSWQGPTRLRLGCLDLWCTDRPGSCPFPTSAKLVTMLNCKREKHILVYIEFDPIAASHGGIAGIPDLTRY